MKTPANHAAGRSGTLKHANRRLPAGGKSWPQIAGVALLLTAAPLSRAAGLGELQRQSALGEPLDVVINLSNGGQAEAGEMTARIASEETYESLGLQRDRALEEAGVRIEKGKGGLRLHVTGPRLVMEPILSLVVEVNYGSGVIRRNYDLLMDPPASDTYYAGAATVPQEQLQAQAQVREQEQAQEQTQPVQPVVADRRRHAVLPEPQSGDAVRVVHHPRVAPDVAQSGDSVPVAWGTTLGDIAAALRARPGIPLSKLEQALYEANPQAFSGGPSRLLAGTRLRVPQSDLFKSYAERVAATAAPAAAAPIPAAPQSDRTELAAAVAASPAAAFVAAAAVPLAERLQLSERLDLSALAAAPPGVPARAVRPGVVPGAAIAATAAVAAAPLRGDGAAAARPGWSLPWRTLLSFPLWGGIALVWLGFAWVRVRRNLAARAKPAPVREALAAPSVYRALSLSGPTGDLGAPAADKARRLHAAERKEVGAFEFQIQDAAPAPTGNPAASAAASVIEVEDTSQYSEAEDFLVAALALHPDRADLRLKLLEIYSAAGNLKGFSEQAQQYIARNKGDRSVHWNEVRRMGLDLDPNWTLLKATGQELPMPMAANAPASKVRRFYDGLDQAGLETALKQLETAYAKVRNDPAFIAAIVELCASEVGLPTPYWYAEALSKRTGGAQIYIKREDLRPLNTDMMVNALGQVMLAKWTGRSSVVAGIEDGRHGEAVAKAAKALNIPAIICVPLGQMSDADHPVIRSLSQLNAILIPTGDEDGLAVPDGRRSAMKRWLDAPGEILYVSSLRSSPMPYPIIVRDFQALIGQEIRRQAFRHGGGLPRAIVSSIDGGYATFGLIQSFLESGDVRIDCVEMQRSDDEAARPAVPGTPSYTRELNWLRTTSRVNFSTVSREDVASTVEMCSQAGETIPRPNNACALAQAVAIARELPANSSVVALFA